MGNHKFKIIESIIYPIIFVLVLWGIKLFEVTSGISFAHYGILPRSYSGIPGIIIAPLIHGDFYHLFSNSLPLAILGIIVVYFYRIIAFQVFFIVYLLSNLIVWMVASGKGYHLGASGLVYGFVGFLFFSGIFRSDKRSMVLSLLVVVVYGGLIWGIFPIHEGVSWESHFFGTISGGMAAYVFRKKGYLIPENKTVPEEKPEDLEEDNL
jgi:membrane associated rhomboid family serine protease